MKIFKMMILLLYLDSREYGDLYFLAENRCVKPSIDRKVDCKNLQGDDIFGVLGIEALWGRALSC